MSCDTEAGRRLAAMREASARTSGTPATAEEAEELLRHASGCEACGAALAEDPALCESLISATQVAGVSPAVAALLEDDEAVMRMAASELLASLPEALRRKLASDPDRFERRWGAADSKDGLDVLRCAAALSEATLVFNTAIAEARRVRVGRTGELLVGERVVPADYVARRLAGAACVDDDVGATLWAKVMEHLVAEGVRLPGFLISRVDDATFAVEPEGASDAEGEPRTGAGAGADPRGLGAPTSCDLLATIRDAVCYNQAAYIQYAFLAAEKHKALKDELRRKPSRSGRAIQGHLVSLVQFLNLELFEALKRNFELLHRVFDGRAGARPRICVKGNLPGAPSDRVVTLIRDRPGASAEGCAVEENTAFHEVFKEGTCYLCNDLPAEYEAGRYRNPRLSPVPPSGITSIRKDWPRLWRDHATSDPTAFYRSTLVIPMTLWNNKLTPEFRRTIRMNDVGRVIFGFLCFDHVDTNYFSSDVDVRVGYVFADLLSQYLITRLVYTEISQTFQEAERCVESARVGAAEGDTDRLIASQDLDPKDTIDRWLTIPIPGLPGGSPFRRGGWGDDIRQGSSGNRLFYSDRFLVEFAHKWSTEAAGERTARAGEEPPPLKN